MVLGVYYLTVEKEGALGEGSVYKDADEVVLAYDAKAVDLHAKIKVRYGSEIIETTAGRVILNSVMPEGLPYINHVVTQKELGNIVAQCYRKLGSAKTAQMLDGIKRLGFTFATRAGITVSISDITIPEDKADILNESENKVEIIEQKFRRGLITEEERYQLIIDVWNRATEAVTKSLLETLDDFNSIYMMAISGARGNIQQIRQLAGMRGLMADPSEEQLSCPLKQLPEGLTVLEYFISTHGARKGLADTALRTADSGYLTRRLVDVAQDAIVREDDCGVLMAL